MDAQQVIGPPKRVRGHTRKQAIWDFEPGKKLTVTFDAGQPVGKEAKELTSFLGTIAKMSQHIDISITDWRKVSEEKKDDLWSIVKEKFEFAPIETEDIKLWIMGDIGRKWKTWKYELKKRSFDSSLTIDEIVATQTDSRVEKQDFRKLVTKWFCEDAQSVSEKKKEIRSKSIEPHVLGTKSFARLAHEEKKKTDVQPTRGNLYIISRTKKNGSIVSEAAAEVINKIQVIGNDTSASTSNTNAGIGIVDWSNDDFAKVKGKEKGDYTRCAGPNIRLPRSKRSRVSQVPMLKAQINELEVEMKDMKERHHIEMKEMKENQAAILQFMAEYKNHNSDKNFSNVFNTTNTVVANDSSSVHNHGPYGNSTSTRASQNKKSAKAVTSPGASNKITHLSSAEIELRTKFLEEDSELMKLHQQFVMSGLILENEFWCIRKVRQRVGYCRQTLKGLKREDVHLLRKFGIQFKGGFENAEPAGNTNSCQRR